MKLTAFDKVIIRILDINFLRNWISLSNAMNINNIANIVLQTCSMVLNECDTMINLVLKA